MPLHGETEEHRLPNPMTDTQALDYITSLLDGEEWGPDTTAEIADAIRRTGREVGDVEDAAAPSSIFPPKHPRFDTKPW